MCGAVLHTLRPRPCDARGRGLHLFGIVARDQAQNRGSGPAANAPADAATIPATNPSTTCCFRFRAEKVVFRSEIFGPAVAGRASNLADSWTIGCALATILSVCW